MPSLARGRKSRRVGPQSVSPGVVSLSHLPRRINERRALEQLSTPVSNARKLDINVIFTTKKGSEAALKRAELLAGDLNSRIYFLAPEIVPFPLPLESPPVDPEFKAERLRALAKSADADVFVEVLLCREARPALSQFLRPGSLVVLAGRRRWWRSTEERLADWLRAQGHRVVFIVAE